MKLRIKSTVVVLAVVALLAISAVSVFAAGPYASAIGVSGPDAVSDLTDSIADAMPYLLGLAVVSLVAKRVLRFFR